MQILSDLLTQALSSDSQEDWLRLYQTVAGLSLVVPLAETPGETARPALQSHEGIEVVPAYASMDAFAAALDAPGAYAEIAGAELAVMLQDQGTPLLVHNTDPILLRPEQLAFIAATFGAEVTRATGSGVTVGTPAPPELALVEALGKTVGALGADCPEAWLVEMTEPEAAPELVLVLGLSDSVRTMEADLAETVTRAIQAVTDRRFAVACPDRGAPLMATARKCGIGIGG